MGFGFNRNPVRVKVYQLRDASTFDRAGFEDLWTDEAKVLGDDLLDKPIVKDVLPKEPGAKQEMVIVIYEEEKSLNINTQFIGVAVLFSPENATPEMASKWKKAVPLDQVGKVIFHMDNYELLVKED